MQDSQMFAWGILLFFAASCSTVPVATQTVDSAQIESRIEFAESSDTSEIRINFQAREVPGDIIFGGGTSHGIPVARVKPVTLASYKEIHPETGREVETCTLSVIPGPKSMGDYGIVVLEIRDISGALRHANSEVIDLRK